MTHPHMTKQCRVNLLDALDIFEGGVSRMENIDMNEDAASILYHLTTVLKHEIELISVEER